MECVQKHCSGKIDVKSGLPIKTGCRSCCTAFPCNKCGRLHFLQGDEVHKRPVGVSHRNGSAVFLVNGEFINKEPE